MFQPYPLGPYGNRNEKSLLLMHIHNSCAGNDDHLTLLIASSNVHKKMLSQTTTHTFRKVKGGRIERFSRMVAAAIYWSFLEIQK